MELSNEEFETFFKELFWEWIEEMNVSVLSTTRIIHQMVSTAVKVGEMHNITIQGFQITNLDGLFLITINDFSFTYDITDREIKDKSPAKSMSSSDPYQL